MTSGASRVRLYQLRYPDRHKARQAVRAEVRARRLIPPGHCEQCGAPTGVTAHHWDYSRLLDVRWLCTDCHQLAHNRPHQKDRHLLVYIQEYTTEHGFPPTVEEIRKALDYSTTSLVHYHLERLRRQGHVRWTPRAKRTLQVTVPEGTAKE